MELILCYLLLSFFANTISGYVNLTASGIFADNTYVVQIGSSVTLTCSNNDKATSVTITDKNGNSNGSCSVFHGAFNCTPSSSYSVDESDRFFNYFKYVISSFQTGDCGTYKCELATNPKVSSSISVQHEVYCNASCGSTCGTCEVNNLTCQNSTNTCACKVGTTPNPDNLTECSPTVSEARAELVSKLLVVSSVMAVLILNMFGDRNRGVGFRKSNTETCEKETDENFRYSGVDARQAVVNDPNHQPNNTQKIALDKHRSQPTSQVGLQERGRGAYLGDGNDDIILKKSPLGEVEVDDEGKTKVEEKEERIKAKMIMN